MNRILILGCAGSGKSTLAKKLGTIFNLKVVYLDTLYWLPGWVERDKEEFTQIQKEVLVTNNWVIDGNYRDTLELRLSYADTVIYLDYKRIVSLIGVFKRYFKYRKKERESITKGCKEKIDKEFFKWVWNFRKKARPLILEKVNACKNVNVYIFKNRRSLNKFLNEINSHK